MKKLYQAAILVIMFGFSGLLVACNTTQAPTDQSTQDITSQEVQATVTKVEPYLQFNANRLLEVSDQGKRELSDKEFLFAQTSIAETNKLVNSGEWKYGESSTSKMVDLRISDKIKPQGLNYWSYEGWESGCGPMYSYTFRNWWAQYVYMDHCNVVQLLRFGDGGNSGDFVNLVSAMAGPAGWLWWGYRIWFRNSDRGNGVWTAQPWAMPVLYVYSR